MRIADLAVHAIESRQRLRLVVRHLDAGYAQGETVNDARQRIQRREMLSGGVRADHLLLRVVRVVVVVSTGGLFPA